MNIKEAKDCIKQTIYLYLLKGSGGAYRIPVNRQRPVALIGPAGIGKTDIVRQAAAEMGVSFLSYTITHHTRQSITGLPRLSTGEFGGRVCHVTKYTMSEIIAEVYQAMEDSGREEGVLFLDEFNCASESIAPLMLEFLQNKRFGPHQLPAGWIIVLAGNPPEYNRSAKELDMAIRDRIRYISIEPSFEIWKDYAAKQGIHPAIRAYLSQNPKHFCLYSKHGFPAQLVTARGWEELSQMLILCEEQMIEVDLHLIAQYLGSEEICRSFMCSYRVFSQVVQPQELDELLNGQASSELKQRCAKLAFDARCAFSLLLAERLRSEIAEYAAAVKECNQISGSLPENVPAFCGGADEASIAQIKERLCTTTEACELLRQQKNREITNVLDFISQVFGTGSELEMLLNELSFSEAAVRLMADGANSVYLKYKKSIFGQLSKAKLTKRIQEAQLCS